MELVHYLLGAFEEGILGTPPPFPPSSSEWPTSACPPPSYQRLLIYAKLSQACHKSQGTQACEHDVGVWGAIRKAHVTATSGDLLFILSPAHIPFPPPHLPSPDLLQWLDRWPIAKPWLKEDTLLKGHNC